MVTEPVEEVIFIGLPGPTHNYGGLAADNVAATKNRGSTSNPKQAAHQALELVGLLSSLGIKTAILPPQLRPHLPMLRQRFSGSPEEIIRQAAREAPALLEKASSSSAMWTANAATVAPGVDARDGKLHLTTANLHTNPHRRIEAADTHRVLTAIFAGTSGCTVHPPLDAAQGLSDEGAANHTRLVPRHGDKGLHVFVYGTSGSPGDPPTARQTLAASQAIKKQHGIADECAVFIKQHPAMIEAGVFHNDVIAVGNASVFLAHEAAYAGGRADLERIAVAYEALHGKKLHVITVTAQELAVKEAVDTYIFNSQIVTRPDGRMAVIAPTEAKELYDGKAARLLERIADEIGELYFIDLRQSMRNGGGPACLRLRVPMTATQLAAIQKNVNVIADNALLADMARIVDAHYPDRITAPDLADPALYFRCRDTLAELGKLMRLPLPAD